MTHKQMKRWQQLLLSICQCANSTHAKEQMSNVKHFLDSLSSSICIFLFKFLGCGPPPSPRTNYSPQNTTSNFPTLRYVGTQLPHKEELVRPWSKALDFQASTNCTLASSLNCVGLVSVHRVVFKHRGCVIRYSHGKRTPPKMVVCQWSFLSTYYFNVDKHPRV